MICRAAAVGTSFACYVHRRILSGLHGRQKRAPCVELRQYCACVASRHDASKPNWLAQKRVANTRVAPVLSCCGLIDRLLSSMFESGQVAGVGPELGEALMKRYPTATAMHAALLDCKAAAQRRGSDPQAACLKLLSEVRPGSLPLASLHRTSDAVRRMQHAHGERA